MKPFYDCRLDAAGQLAVALEGYCRAKPIVRVIAPGAVEMGVALAAELGAGVDVALVRKLPAPFCPHLAVGAVDDSGYTYLAPHAFGAGASAAYLRVEKSRQLVILRRQRRLYPARRNLAGRTVIVVDDGMTTGSTMITALLAAREQRPALLVCAVPVAAPEVAFALRACVDELVCLRTPADFDAVAPCYRFYPRVTDTDAAAFARRAVAQAPSAI